MILMQFSSKAQTYISRMQHLDAYDGLSDNLVTSLVQMDDGILWIATMDGLNSYDGFSFREFNTINSKLNSNVIKCVTRIEDTLIVLTGSPNSVHRAAGLFVLHSHGEDFLPFTDIYGALPFPLDEIRMCKVYNGFMVFALIEGKVWTFNISEHKWSITERFSDTGGSFIYQDKILICTHEGVQAYRIDDQALESHFPNTGLIHALALRIKTDLNYYGISHALELSKYSPRRKLSWIPVSNYLVGINDNGGVINFYSGDQMLAFEREVKAIEIDEAHDLLYVGTEDGLYVISVEPDFFHAYFNVSSEMLYSKEKRFACRGIGVIGDTLYANGPFGTYRAALKPQSDILPVINERMLPIHVVNGKELLFGRNFLMRYLPSSGHPEVLVNKGVVNQLWSILAHDGLYFLGSSDGVTVLDSALLEQGQVHSVCENGLKGNALYVYDIKIVTGDRLCYSTSRGLFMGKSDQCDPHKISFRDESGRPGHFNQFSHTLEDKDSHFWTATLDGGIIHFQLIDSVAIIINQINKENGLPTNTCYAIYSDKTGNKWVSTDYGIVLLRPDMTFRIYTTDDGLPDNEFNRISHFQDVHGNIYFGGLNGVVAFSPNEFEARSAGNLLLNILSFSQFSGWQNTVLEKTASVASFQIVKFKPGDKFFEIRVGLNDLYETKNHIYEFRYSNINEEWQPMRGNALRQNTLPYGKHTLEIRGRNANGEFAANTISLSVLAIRPVYMKWWFFLTLAFGCILIIREYLLHKMRQVSKLEDLVRQRTHIIEEQADALRKSEAARTRFFANISHELRTPLTLIKAPLEKLIRTDGNREKLLEDYAGMMLSNAELLHERIDDLLTLSQADAGQLKLKEASINLNSFLERLTDNFRGLADQSQLRINLQNDTPASLVIRADRKKVEHILLNYLTNAIKHSGKSAAIGLRCYLQDDQLVFSVSDHGPGIAAEEISKIFDRFYQIGKSAGVGLGLALSQELAGVMKGSVWVESKWGMGSTFYLSIPFVEANEEAEAVEGMMPAPLLTPEVNGSSFRSNGTMHAARILCVEDNPAMRSFLVAELSHYHVETCVHGVEALQLLDRQYAARSLPDCIVSDIMMPQMDGFEFLNKVKSIEKYNSIPFVMLTARAGVEDKLQALRIGVDDYISKPFNAEELRTRIENLIGRKEQKPDPGLNPDESPVVNNEWLRNVEEIIKRRLDESDLTMESIALDIHLSRSQFFRKIKSLTGLTPNMYLREVRLFKSRELLESGKVTSVKELSASVGFESPSYFSQLYQERFGYRPSERM